MTQIVEDEKRLFEQLQFIDDIKEFKSFVSMDDCFMKKMGQTIINCAGVIVFDSDRPSTTSKTVIVKTHMGHGGFPKGKRKKGEPRLITALREMGEETGLMPKQIEIMWDKRTIIEKSRKGFPSIVYYIAHLKQSHETLPKVGCIDPDELDEVCWMNVGELLQMPEEHFYSKRKEILQTIIQLE